MNICFNGAIYNCSGYAQIRHLFLQLSKRGHSVLLRPYSSKDAIKILYDKELRDLEKTNLQKPYINIASGIAPQLRIDQEACFNIAHSMFETTDIPENWVDNYNQFDEIWVPSVFCKKAFNRKDVRCNAFVVPFGVEKNCLLQEKKKHDLFTFLAVGQWIDRKGWDLLIQAYVAEFMGDYNVRLCIKTYNDIKTNEEMIKEYLDPNVRNSTYMPRIMIKNQKVDEERMSTFYQEADCFVLPSRGEAFCIPFLEAMAHGVPVIATDFGGHKDFINEDIGWFIDVKQLRRLSERLCKINVCYKNLWFAEPDINSIRHLLRYTYEHKNEVKQKGNRAQQFVSHNHTWEHVTDIAENRLNEIFKAIKE